MTTVLAVQVREVDPPQYLADDLEDLADRYPGPWNGEQCDNCGCPGFTVEHVYNNAPKDNLNNWQVRCSGYVYDDENAAPGCGALYHIRELDQDEVMF